MQRCQWRSVPWGWSLQTLRCCGAFRMGFSRLVRSLGFVGFVAVQSPRLTFARSLRMTTMTKMSKMSKSVKTGRPQRLRGLPQRILWRAERRESRESRERRERRETTTPEHWALSNSEQSHYSHCVSLQHCLTLFWWGRTSWYIMTTCRRLRWVTNFIPM